MSPRTPEQNIEKRGATRQKIMEVALGLFANNGYHTTSISQIAKQAKISKGLMYNYFESKEELLKEILFFGAERSLASFDLNRDGVLTRDELLHFIRESFKLVREHKNFWKFYYSVVYQPSVMEIFGNQIIEQYQIYSRIINEYFRNQGADDPEVEMKLFTAMMDGVAVSYLRDPGHFPLEAVEGKVLKMYSQEM